MVLDIAVIGLCLLSFAFFWHLSKRLQHMEKIGMDMPVFLKGMTGLLDKITQNISTLRSHALATQKKIDEKIPEAKEATEELSILVEHSQRIMQRLDQLVIQAQEAEIALRMKPKPSIKSESDEIRIPEEPTLHATRDHGLSEKVLSLLRGTR